MSSQSRRGAIAMRGNIRSRPLANTTEDGNNGTQRNFRAYVPQSRPADASRETQQNNKLYRPEPRKLATGSSVGSERRRPGINGREVTINLYSEASRGYGFFLSGEFGLTFHNRKLVKNRHICRKT